MTELFDYFNRASQRHIVAPVAQARGVITRVVGLTLEAKGLNVAVGTRCLVSLDANRQTVNAADEDNVYEVEVVGFDGETTFLMPLKAIDGLTPGAIVVPAKNGLLLPVGDGLLGRVVNGIGQPIDGLGTLAEVIVSDTVAGEAAAGSADFDASEAFNADAGSADKAAMTSVSLVADTINPLHRTPIDTPLDVGIRSINSLLTVGCGQRIGLFAGSGVGKSVLLGMMTRFTEADVVVVALVGERGREVREFVEINLGAKGLAKSVVVASPADDTPVMRLRAGMYAARLSEYFRDRGKKTLLLFDSLTRFAQAQREVALAAGEPPATRGYPPSVFSLLPRLVERAGNGTGNGGSVTGIYTVLAEDGEINDPVSDAARAILDGHIVLSRTLAGEGVYPAVDIQASISRAMNSIVPMAQQHSANQLKQWIARYSDSRDLINVGAYTAGIDPVTDTAIKKQPEIREFLMQQLDESVSFQMSVTALDVLVADDGSASAQPATANSPIAGSGVAVDGAVAQVTQPPMAHAQPLATATPGPGLTPQSI